MKDYIKQIIANAPDNNLARCLVREYLQSQVLEGLQENGAFVNWVFVGGTALRFLYSIPRFSEDLDFSLVKTGVEDNFAVLMKKIKAKFEAQDYKLTSKVKIEKTVKSAFLNFEGLLFEIGLSGHKTETISIKVELDTNPPQGAGLERTIVRRHCLLNLQHYDKASLFAGKLHALLARRYIKGRDVYDFIWYLSDSSKLEPNIILLNNALKQTGWKGREFTQKNWRKVIALHISKYDWGNIIKDVRPFLEKQSELALLTKDNLLKLLEYKS